MMKNGHAGLMAELETQLKVQTWLTHGRAVSEEIANGDRLFNAWEVVLRFIWEMQFKGACHDTSAVLYILLSELGLSPSLKIGEVKADVGIFDHSWVEVDDLIFDAAVSLPQDEGAFVGGPVFGSIDLATNRHTDLVYGVNSGQGLGEAALPAASLNLSGFAAIQPQPDIWTLAVAFGGRIGLDLTFKDIMRKYGTVRRTICVHG